MYGSLMNPLKHPSAIGLSLALFGALLLTPDTLFMRLSKLDGFTMLAWRGGLSGVGYILIWAWFNLRLEQKMPKVLTLSFIVVIICQISNATFFSLAIAIAPVTIVLISVATAPIFSAVLSWFFLGEALSKFSIAAASLVLIGLYISVLGEDARLIELDAPTLLGALFGLGVAFSLAMNFTVIRKDKDVPFVLAIGIGAFFAGGLGLLCADNLYWPPIKNIAAIAFTGIIILPVSFCTLSYAARFVPSSTVSLIMLLETVLGPLWIWWGIGEEPTNFMLLGGLIVILSLAAFLIDQSKKKSTGPSPGMGSGDA
jgi:drug/metabolite transporter (DMT)-like permease|tara:strand:- start:172 stop:1110 length:939 start_codon:yes stop_codon:yes gene_type:complete